ncbi:protein phosphatase 1 regulatory subunit 3A-like [Cololabis saira]|uniref:protein phosphatase 1 regulatory subunit 3A-like n=1 Tax=Cololabis saira TaxID=129043 RepID=UPI002AD438F6|nr:protein phosphatase 1 regulatory subunit 3A-like [Cololabis saira]
MASAGPPRRSQAANLLYVPSFCPLDVDEDEADPVIGIRPKSSPIPRRRSSISDEEPDPEPPPSASGSRRVSFADAKGLSLVLVKEFAKWDVPKLPGYDPPEGEGVDLEEFHISPSTFSLPWPMEELFAQVLRQKVELENIELLPGTTILKGVIRVLNVSFDKAVYIRTSLDKWSTHFDLLAEYVPGSSDGVTDCFSFKLTLVPPFGQQGARVDFCLRYETPAGTFWSNNNSKNYVVFCHHGQRDRPQRDGVNKKSCLKTSSQNFSTADDASSQDNMSTDESNVGLEVDTRKAQQSSAGQPEASEQRQQKSLVEEKQNSSRRRRRKAARISKVKDHFAQRDGGENDAGRNETPAEIKQPTQEGKPGEEHAHDDTCSTEPETSEPVGLVEVQIQDMPLHSADRSAEKQNITSPVARSEDENPDVSYESSERSEAAGAEGPAGQTGSFTFGTVVAPLYRQVSGKLGGESPNARDEENPHPSERRRAGRRVSADTGRKSNDVQSDKTSDRELNHKHLEVTLDNPSSEEEETSVAMNNVLDPAGFNSPQSPRALPGRLNREDVSSHTDWLNPQVTDDGLHLQGNAWKEDLTFDPPGQTTAKSQPQTVTNNDENHAQSGIQAVVKPSLTVSEHFSDSGEEVNPDRDRGETETALENSTKEEEETLLEVTDELNQSDDPATNSNDVVMPEYSPETQETCDVGGEIQIGREESEAVTRKRHPADASEEMEHHEVEAGVSKEDEDLYLADINEVKNWEMMVEEEENDVLTNKEEPEIINSNGAASGEENEEEETVEDVEEDMIAADVKHEEVDNDVALEDKDWTREDESEETEAPKVMKPEVIKVENTDGAEDRVVEKTEGPGEAESFMEIQITGVEEEGRMEEEEKMRVNLNSGVERQSQAKAKDGEEQNSDQTEGKRDDEADEGDDIVVGDSCVAVEDREDRAGSFKDESDAAQSEVEGSSSAPDRYTEDGFQSSEGVATNEPEGDLPGHDSSSAESDSDDEVELYMHCLRAAGTSAQKARSRDAAFSGSKRPSISRSKPPPASMPRISESLDEDRPSCSPQETREDVTAVAGAAAAGAAAAEAAAAPAVPAASSRPCSQNAAWWKNTLSCSNIMKTLLCTTLLVVFLAVAYHFDFLACFGLYLASVVWLYCQGERQPVKNNNKAATEK